MRRVPLVIDILRHGEAEASSPDGDGGRALSESGIAQVRALGRRLAADGWSPDRVFASPLRRARETAAIVVEPLPAPLPIETLHELLPECDPAELTESLRAAAGETGHVLLVSHMPLVARLCGFLCGRVEALMPADLVRLACADGPGRGRAVWRGFPARRDSS